MVHISLHNCYNERHERVHQMLGSEPGPKEVRHEFKKKEAKGMTYFHGERRCATHLLNYVAPILEFLDDELRR